MRELEEVPLSSQYSLISSEFTMALCNYVQINWWALKIRYLASTIRVWQTGFNHKSLTDSKRIWSCKITSYSGGGTKYVYVIPAYMYITSTTKLWNAQGKEQIIWHINCFDSVLNHFNEILTFNRLAEDIKRAITTRGKENQLNLHLYLTELAQFLREKP